MNGLYIARGNCGHIYFFLCNKQINTVAFVWYRAEDIVQGISGAYINRYKQSEDETMANLEIAGRESEKKHLLKFFPDEATFEQTIRPFTALLNKKDSKLEKQTLKVSPNFASYYIRVETTIFVKRI